MIDPPPSPHRALVMLDDAPALLAAAQAGDPLALDALVRGCAPAVLRWCRRLGGPRVDAEDAAQDVLVVVFRNIGRVDGPGALGPWMFGVTRRVLADHRRRAWVARWLPGVVRERADPVTPHHRAVFGEAAAAVQLALEAMPAAQREAFVLCVVDEHTDDEAAALLGVPVGTLKSRLRLARARMAAHARTHPALAADAAWEEP